MTRFELEEREQPVEDTTEVDWMNDTTGVDTIEYRAVDLVYDVETSTFNLNNSAQLKYRTATLESDTIWMDQKNQILAASGNPVLRETKNPSLSGMRLKYNLKSKIGEVYYATTFQDNQQLNGMEVRRLPDTRIQIARGDFSTCNDTTHQHFYFYGRRMVVKPKETITARPVVLNIADVPVAVLPMIVAPLKSGRKSGLLTPKFGGDQKQGFYLRNIGFYYAANDYWDATISGDIIEGDEARFERSTLSGEIRYRKRYLLDGYLRYTSYLQEFDFSNSGYDISFLHNQNLTPDAKHTLSGQGSFVSSKNVRKNNSLEASTILNQQANASLAYSGKFGNNKSLTVKISQSHNLTTGMLERNLPDIQYRMSGNLFNFELEEGEVAESGFLHKIKRFPAQDLLGSVAGELHSHQRINQLHKTRAVDAERGTAAPKIRGSEQGKGQFPKEFHTLHPGDIRNALRRPPAFRIRNRGVLRKRAPFWFRHHQGSHSQHIRHTHATC